MRTSSLRAADLGDDVTDDRHWNTTRRQRGFGSGWTQGTPGCICFVSVSNLCDGGISEMAQEGMPRLTPQFALHWLSIKFGCGVHGFKKYLLHV